MVPNTMAQGAAGKVMVPDTVPWHTFRGLLESVPWWVKANLVAQGEPTQY